MYNISDDDAGIYKHKCIELDKYVSLYEGSRAVSSDRFMVDYCLSWKDSILENQRKIERRKDNSDIIDHPLGNLVFSGGVGIIWRLLKESDLLKHIYFAKLSYLGPLVEILVYSLIHDQKSYEDFITCFSNTNVQLIKHYPVPEVEKRAYAGFKAKQAQIERDRQEEAEKLLNEKISKGQFNEKLLYDFISNAHYFSLNSILDIWYQMIERAYNEPDCRFDSFIILAYNSIVSLLDLYDNMASIDDWFFCFLLKYAVDLNNITSVFHDLEKNFPELLHNPDFDSTTCEFEFNENERLTKAEKVHFIKDFPFLFTDQYMVAYRSVHTGTQCNICCIRLINTKVNIPLYDINDPSSYLGTFVAEIHMCPVCRRYYITEQDKRKIETHVEYMKTKRIVCGDDDDKRKNTFVIHYDEHYLDYTFINNGFLIDYKQNIADHSDDEDDEDSIISDYALNQLNDESFLAEMGYSVSVDEENRHVILQKAIILYGKRKIIDHLQFCINMRKNRQGNYTNALAVWSEDIQFVIQS